MSDSTSTELLPWHEEIFGQLRTLHAEARLAHAYLLQGQPGLGKLKLARHLARYLLCQSPAAGQPCNHCRSCLLFKAGAHPDLCCVEPEEGKRIISVDQIRQTLDFMARTSGLGSCKVVILNPAESMNINAANALLKALEEPAQDTFVLLISHQPALLLATVRSRCQKLKLVTPDTALAKHWLESKNVGAGLSVLLNLADGAPLRALALADEDAQHERLVLHESLLQLLQKKISIMDAARDCASFSISNNIDGMMYCLMDILRFNQSRGQVGLRDPEINTLALHFNSRAATRNLHRLRQQLLEARRAIVTNTNPNPLLLLESLFFAWSDAAGCVGPGPETTT
ncbi:MAG: DNA polymerase III subunit delta' [Pseudohongiellaceae bacterium]